MDGIDVEEVFTFLSERVQAPAVSSQLRASYKGVWNALLRGFVPVFSGFKANAATRRLYRRLLDNQIRRRDTVVSFNYDTIFERSLPGGYAWHYVGLENRDRSLRVLKPHGSWNWMQSHDGEIIVEDSPELPVIVAPTHLKFIKASGTDRETDDESSENPQLAGYLEQAPQIGAIWAMMEKQMRDARALIFVGYSFPSSDLYFSSVLRSVLADRTASPAIVIVNPDAVAIEARISSCFPIDAPLIYFDLETFSHFTRPQLLSAIAARA